MVIQDMPPPKDLKELCGLQRRLAYIQLFISDLVGRCHAFSHLMKKGSPFEWDESCHKAFTSIKKYLSIPSVLGAPILVKPLIIYIAAQERSLRALCDKKIMKVKRKLYTTLISRTLVRVIFKADPIKTSYEDQFCPNESRSGQFS